MSTFVASLDPVDRLSAALYGRAGEPRPPGLQSVFSPLEADRVVLDAVDQDGRPLDEERAALLAQPSLLVLSETLAADGLFGRLMLTGSADRLLVGQRDGDQYRVTGELTADQLAAMLGEQSSGAWRRTSPPGAEPTLIALTTVAVTGDRIVAGAALMAVPPPLDELDADDLGPAAAADVAGEFLVALSPADDAEPLRFPGGLDGLGELVDDDTIAPIVAAAETTVLIVGGPEVAAVLSGPAGTIVAVEADGGIETSVRPSTRGLLGATHDVVEALAALGGEPGLPACALELRRDLAGKAPVIATLAFNWGLGGTLRLDLPDGEDADHTPSEVVGALAVLLLEALSATA